MAKRKSLAHTALITGGGLFPLDRAFRGADVAMSSKLLSQLVREGFLRRLLRGVYAASQISDSIELRAQALGLVIPPRAVVTDRTAAWLHGVDVLLPGAHLEVPPVQVFHSGRGHRLRRPEVVTGQRMMRHADVEVIEGVPVTTLLRTACDLGRLQHADRAFGSLDAMLRAGVDHDQLLFTIERFKGYRGVRQARALAPLADARAESMAESITRRRWLGTSCPAPEPQRPVMGPDGQVWWLDLGLDELYFAVEYDGNRFHSDEVDVEHDRERRATIESWTPWHVEVVGSKNIFGREQDFQAKLPRWIADARRTLSQRLWRAEIA